MKRVLSVVAIVLLASSAFAADERAIKRDLIRELLAVIDVKALTQSMFDVIFDGIFNASATNAGLENMSAEDRKQYEVELKKQSDQLRTYRDKLYTRIDYVKWADEVYAPIFEKHFTSDELRQLIVFYKTPTGQKTAKMIPEFVIGSLMKGSEMMSQVAQEVGAEMEKEENAKNPARKTMADLRTVATAAEAYATDENRYPKVSGYKDLGPILSPTYIRTMPEKDEWGTPFMYVVSPDGAHYRFISAGADRKFDWNASQIETLPENFQTRFMEKADADIIFQDGQFVQAPAGSMKE